MTKRTWDPERFLSSGQRLIERTDLDGDVLLDKTNLVSADVGLAIRYIAERAIRGLADLNNGRVTKPLPQRLRLYREHSEDLIRCYALMNELWMASTRETGQLLGEQATAARKRWTEIEDEALVEHACQDDSTLITLAMRFNRTPTAITSRLTYLVGVSRAPKELIGRLTGYLDGELVAGHFEGQLKPDGVMP